MTLLTRPVIAVSRFEGNTSNLETTIEGNSGNHKTTIEAQSLRGEAAISSISSTGLYRLCRSNPVPLPQSF
jgi:hypothetical protein